MHEVVFYRDKNGKEPVKEYLQDLTQRKEKDSRITLNKIQTIRVTLIKSKNSDILFSWKSSKPSRTWNTPSASG
jgi:phage-related protein